MFWEHREQRIVLLFYTSLVLKFLEVYAEYNNVPNGEIIRIIDAILYELANVSRESAQNIEVILEDAPQETMTEILEMQELLRISLQLEQVDILQLSQTLHERIEILN
jgi:hypothetical protein